MYPKSAHVPGGFTRFRRATRSPVNVVCEARLGAPNFSRHIVRRLPVFRALEGSFPAIPVAASVPPSI
jgi:hypothetical protein